MLLERSLFPMSKQTTNTNTSIPSIDPTTAATLAAVSTIRRKPLVKQIATWPPLVYVLLGALALLFWAGGTAIQVQTSEAWIMGVPLTRFPSIATFGQLWDFAWGRLPVEAIVPFSFG